MEGGGREEVGRGEGGSGRKGGKGMKEKKEQEDGDVSSDASSVEKEKSDNEGGGVFEGMRTGVPHCTPLGGTAHNTDRGGTH